MLKLFLWLRYLRKRRIVFLSIAAVALSVSLLVVVASLFTGFIDAYERIAVEFMGDVVLQPPKKFSNHPQFIERLEKLKAIDTATATLTAHGVLYLGKGNVRAVSIHGIDAAGAVKVTNFKNSLLRQKGLPSEPSFNVAADPNAVGAFIGIATIKEPDEQTDEYDFEAAEGMLGEKIVLTTGAVTEQKDPSTNDPTGGIKRKQCRSRSPILSLQGSTISTRTISSCRSTNYRRPFIRSEASLWPNSSRSS